MSDTNIDTVGTQELTVQGMIVTIVAPYAEGHSLTDAEASALNQLLAENVRNNTSGFIAKRRKELAEAAGVDVGSFELPPDEIAELSAKVVQYAAEYTFSGRRTPRTHIDPVQRESERIARDMITAALRAKGKKVKELPEGHLDKLISELLDKKPAIREEAKRRIDTLSNVAEALDFGE